MLSPKFIMRFNFTSVKKKLEKKLSGGRQPLFVAEETKVKVGRREGFIQVFPANVTFRISFSYFFLGQHPRQVHLDWSLLPYWDANSTLNRSPSAVNWQICWLCTQHQCVISLSWSLASDRKPVFWCVLYQRAMYTPPNFNRLYWLSPSGKEVAGNKNVWS